MIKHVSGRGSVAVEPIMAHPYFNSVGLGAGQVRYNPTTYSMEVYDGSYWKAMDNSVNITLTPAAEDAIQWAMKRMLEEKKIEEYAVKYPSVAAAYEHHKKSEEILNSVINLVKDY
jgi:hypothetical protein